MDSLIPDEVRDDVHQLYKTGKLTDHRLKSRVLQAGTDFFSTNEIEKCPQVVIVLSKYWYVRYGIESMRDYLSKLLCGRGKGMGLI